MGFIVDKYDIISYVYIVIGEYENRDGSKFEKILFVGNRETDDFKKRVDNIIKYDIPFENNFFPNPIKYDELLYNIFNSLEEKHCLKNIRIEKVEQYD